MFGTCVHGPAFDASPVQVCAYVRHAGAVGSLKWKGIEFINRSDHGRELQSAVSYDGLGEADNPTEAGSQDDGGQPISSSLFFGIKSAGANLATKARMAFWKPFRGQTISTTFLAKDVTVGWQGFPNVVKYDVSIRVGEAHSRIGFEALTGYMPPSFDQFYTYRAKHLTPLASPSGDLAMAHQPLPIIVVDRKRGVAMGIWSAQPPRFYASGVFTSQRVAKWSVFFDETPAPAPATYAHEILLAVGKLTDVERAMDAMHAP
jgi:hypothetical protein